MKATVTITSRGVVTLPAKLRQELGLESDDQLIAEITPEGLLLRPAVTLPHRPLAATAPAATVPAVELAWLAEKDRPVLAAAMRLRCDALVTGDCTLSGAGHGRSFGGVTFHSPRSLAERVMQ
jgi:AbrB family looped-hinge helix DNA binding protein